MSESEVSWSFWAPRASKQASIFCTFEMCLTFLKVMERIDI